MFYIRTKSSLFVHDSSIRHSSLSVVQFDYAYNMHTIFGYVKWSTTVVNSHPTFGFKCQRFYLSLSQFFKSGYSLPNSLGVFYLVLMFALECWANHEVNFLELAL